MIKLNHVNKTKLICTLAGAVIGGSLVAAELNSSEAYIPTYVVESTTYRNFTNQNGENEIEEIPNYSTRLTKTEISKLDAVVFNQYSDWKEYNPTLSNDKDVELYRYQYTGAISADRISEEDLDTIIEQYTSQDYFGAYQTIQDYKRCFVHSQEEDSTTIDTTDTENLSHGELTVVDVDYDHPILTPETETSKKERKQSNVLLPLLYAGMFGIAGYTLADTKDDSRNNTEVPKEKVR